MSSLFCGVCGKTGDVQVCTGCEEVYYCGRECQLKDWPTHKVRCKQIQARRRAQAELLQKRKAEEAIPAPQPRPQQLHPTSTAPTITTTTTIIAPAVTATPKISVNAPPAQQQQQQQPASSSSSSPPPPPSAFQPSPPQHGLKGKESGPVTLASSTSGGGGSSGGVVNSAPSPAPQGEEHKSRMDKFTSFTKKIGGSAKKGFESFKDSVGEKTRKLKGNSHEDSNASTANTVSTAGSSGPTSVAAANATMDQLLAPPSPGDPHAVFGVPFETAIERASTTVAGIPDIMIYSFSFLEKNGLDEEGLFRLSGSLREIAKLRGTFQKGEIPPINAVGDPHVISGLLKLYFRELPEPLFEKKNPNPPASDPARGVYRPLFDSVCNEFKKPIQLLFWFLHKVKQKNKK